MAVTEFERAFLHVEGEVGDVDEAGGLSDGRRHPQHLTTRLHDAVGGGKDVRR